MKFPRPGDVVFLLVAVLAGALLLRTPAPAVASAGAKYAASSSSTHAEGNVHDGRLWMYEPHSIPKYSDFAGPDGAILPRVAGTTDLTDDLNWALGNAPGSKPKRYIFIRSEGTIRNPIVINTPEDLYIHGSDQYHTAVRGTDPCAPLFTVVGAHVVNLAGLDFKGTKEDMIMKWFQDYSLAGGESCQQLGFLDNRCTRVPLEAPARCPGRLARGEPETGVGLLNGARFISPDGSVNKGPVTLGAINQRIFDFKQKDPILFEMSDVTYGGVYFDANGPGYFRLQSVSGSGGGLTDTTVAVSDNRADLLVVGGDMSEAGIFGSLVLRPGYKKGYSFWQRRGRLRVYGTTMELIDAESDIRIDRAAPRLGPEPGPHVLASIRTEGQNNGTLTNVGVSSDPLNPRVGFGRFLLVPSKRDPDIVRTGGRTAAEDKVDVLVEDNQLPIGVFSWTDDPAWTSDDARHPRCIVRGNGSCITRFPRAPQAPLTQLAGVSRQSEVCYCPNLKDPAGEKKGPWKLTAPGAAILTDYSASGHLWLIRNEAGGMGHLAVSNSGDGSAKAARVIALGNTVYNRNISDLVAIGSHNVVSDNVYARFHLPWYCETTADGGICARDDAGVPYDPTASPTFFRDFSAFAEDMLEENARPATFPAVPSAALPPPLRRPTADFVDTSQSQIPDGGATPEQFGLLNVKTMEGGARGDGVSDDTDALNRAFNKHIQLYLPAGTYCVHAPVNWVNPWGGGWLAGAGSCDATIDGDHCPAKTTTIRGDCPGVESTQSKTTVFFSAGLGNSTIQGITFRTAAYDPVNPPPDAGAPSPAPGLAADTRYHAVVQIENGGGGPNTWDDVAFRGGIQGVSIGAYEGEEAIMITNALFADSMVGFYSWGPNELCQQLYGTRFVDNEETFSTGPIQQGLAVYNTTVRGTRAREFAGTAYVNGLDSDTQILSTSESLNLFFENSHLRAPAEGLRFWDSDAGAANHYAQPSFARIFTADQPWWGNVQWFPQDVASTKLNAVNPGAAGMVAFLNSTVDQLTFTIPRGDPVSLLQLGSRISLSAETFDVIAGSSPFTGIGPPAAQQGKGCSFIGDKSSPYYMDASCFARHDCPCHRLHLACLQSCPFSPRFAVKTNGYPPDAGAPDDWGHPNEFQYTPAKWLIEETDGGIATALCSLYRGVPEGEPGFQMHPLQTTCGDPH